VARSEIASFLFYVPTPPPAYNTVIVFRNKISPIFFSWRKWTRLSILFVFRKPIFQCPSGKKNWEETISIFKFFLQIWMLTLCSFFNSSTGKMSFCFSLFTFCLCLRKNRSFLLYLLILFCSIVISRSFKPVRFVFVYG
jgi:hypothetical protein